MVRLFQAKRLDGKSSEDIVAQIFAEMLSAAVENRKYLSLTDPYANTKNLLPGEEDKMKKAKENEPIKRNGDDAPYHDVCQPP